MWYISGPTTSSAQQCNANRAVSGPESTEISLFDLSCTELTLIGLLLPIALVQLLVHVQWWDQFVPLGWVVARREGDIFIFSQQFFTPAAIALAPWTSCAPVHYHPRTLPT
jgi:hypothetical protein